METNKTSVLESISDYPKELDFLISSLLIVASKQYQIDIWYNEKGPEIDSYDDSFFDLNDSIRYFKYLIRKKLVFLTDPQIFSILKLSAMSNFFNRKVRLNGKVPEDQRDQHLYIINHPDWIKISKQAEYALSLLKK